MKFEIVYFGSSTEIKTWSQELNEIEIALQ